MFRILTVCTGNICRSPLAESILRQDLPPEQFAVSSAGIMAVPNGQVPEPQLRVASAIGITDMEQHRAQSLTEGKLGLADLVLGLSRGHRKRTVRLDPTAVRRTFTLREFAHLAAYVTPEDVEECLPESTTALTAAVEAVARKRGMVAPPPSQDYYDVVDPFRQSRAVYKLSRDQLVPAAETTAAYLNGILNIFGVDAGVDERQVMTEPDIISQGIPMVMDVPKRAELRQKLKFGWRPLNGQ